MPRCLRQAVGIVPADKVASLPLLGLPNFSTFGESAGARVIAARVAHLTSYRASFSGSNSHPMPKRSGTMTLPSLNSSRLSEVISSSML